jgi:hypothetical protein
MKTLKGILGRIALWTFLVIAAQAVFAQSGAATEAKRDGAQSANKSLANGLYMTCCFTASWSSSSIAVTLNQINNDSFTRTSGSLRLEVWAVASPPARAGAFSGYRLAVGPQYDPLLPRTFYSNLAFTAAFTPPPDGTYWIVLSLAEFDSIDCPASDPWCTNSDSFNSDSTATFGAPTPPPPPPTTAALENPAAGSYQSGIGLISGWSCQGPVTVSVDGTSISAPYGAPRGDTAATCGGSNNGFGLLVNYNNFGPGMHTAQLFVNGSARGNPVSFFVTVPSGEFMRGLSKSLTVPNFPSPGRTTTLVWQESQQNFAIQSVFP